MKGRKPKPSKLKILTGNPGKRKLNEREPAPAPEKVCPPGHLAGEALEEWNRLAPQLFTLGLLTGLDRAALAAYCCCYARWVAAEKLLKKGLLVPGKTIHPAVRIAQAALKEMRAFAVEFGLTPSSRSRVTAETPTRDALDDFLAG